MKSGLTALTVTMTTGSNTYKDHPTAQILPMVTQTQLHVTQFCSAHLPKSQPCTPTTQLPINDKHMLTRPPLPLLPPPPPIFPSPIYHCSIKQLLCGVEPSQTLCKITAHNYWPEHDCDGNISNMKYTHPFKERQTDRQRRKKKKRTGHKEIQAKNFDRAAGRLVNKAKAEENTTSSHTGEKRTKVYAESTSGQSY